MPRTHQLSIIDVIPFFSHPSIVRVGCENRILLKTPLSLLSLLWFRPLAGEPQFVTGIDFPLHHLSWFNINGRSQREGQVHIALGDGFFAPDSLNLG